MYCSTTALEKIINCLRWYFYSVLLLPCFPFPISVFLPRAPHIYINLWEQGMYGWIYLFRTSCPFDWKLSPNKIGGCLLCSLACSYIRLFPLYSLTHLFSKHLPTIYICIRYSAKCSKNNNAYLIYHNPHESFITSVV